MDDKSDALKGPAGGSAAAKPAPTGKYVPPSLRDGAGKRLPESGGSAPMRRLGGACRGRLPPSGAADAARGQTKTRSA